MSANVYSIEDLLKGQFYRSRTIEGEITFAEKRDDVWYEGCETYLVTIRPANSIRYAYRTVAVKTENL